MCVCDLKYKYELSIKQKILFWALRLSYETCLQIIRYNSYIVKEAQGFVFFFNTLVVVLWLQHNHTNMYTQRLTFF